MGDNRNYWGSFNCPPERPDCIAIDKGEAFKVGEITTIKDSVTKNISFLDEIAVIKNLGLIQLLDETNFNRVAKQIKDQTNALANLKMAYEQDMALAKKSLDDALIFSYAVETAKIAAKRANLNASIYEKAFLTAFIFEYNRDGLDRLATKPWSSINNLKALDSAVKITRLSQQADEIDSKYNFKSATLLNNLCGKVFINEASYKRDFSFISKLYLKVTKKKL